MGEGASQEYQRGRRGRGGISDTEADCDNDSLGPVCLLARPLPPSGYSTPDLDSNPKLRRNVCQKFDWQFKKKKKRSPHSLGTGPHCPLFIRLYTFIWGRINHILKRKYCLVPPIVSSGWPSWTSSVLQRELMNRWFYLLKCLLIHTDTLGMKSIYFVIVKKEKSNWVNLADALGLKSVRRPSLFYSFLSSWVSLSPRSCKYLSKNASITGSC